MNFEVSNNPEVTTPVKSCIKTRSMYRMSQQSADNQTRN